MYDLTITNPAFQNSNPEASSGKLWPQFVKKAFEVTKPEGTVAMITPNSWTKGEVSPHGSGGLLKLFASYDTKVINNKDCSKYFPKVGVTFSYFVVRKSTPTGVTKVIQDEMETTVDLSKVRFLPKNVKCLDLVHKFFNNETFDNHLITNTRNKYMKLSENKKKYKVCSNGKISYTTRTQYDNDLKVCLPWANLLDKTVGGRMVAGDSTLVFPCNRGEMRNLKSVLTSKLYRFCNDQLKMAHHNEAARLFPKVDLSRSWTDEELYDHFGLTKEERRFCEDV